MYGGKRRCARSVQRDRRPFEAKDERHSPSRDAARSAEEQVVLPAGGYHFPVLAAANAEVHTCATASQPLRVDARILQGLPGCLQQYPLLRVHHARFDW